MASTAQQWKAQVTEDVKVPSGNTAKLRRLGPEALVTKNGIPDALSGIVMQAVRDKQGLRPEKTAELVQDPQLMAEMVELINNITCRAVVEPVVLPIPPAYSERDPDALYVDEVDWEDKMFIMNYTVGGTRDLASFREQYQESVAAVEASAGVSGPGE